MDQLFILNLVHQKYTIIKSFLLKDSFNRAINNCNFISKVSDKVFISDYESAINSNMENILSLIDCDLKSQKEILSDGNFSSKIENIPSDITDQLALIIPKLNNCYNYINQNNQTLIHCQKGMSRSSFVFLYYQLKDYYTNNTHKKPILCELIVLLKAKRNCIMIADIFIMMLCYIEFIYLFDPRQNNI